MLKALNGLTDTKTIFQNRRAVPFLAMIAVCAWGLAYPVIKIGMRDFGIESTDTASKTLFAGIRFLIAGIVVLLLAHAKGESLRLDRSKAVWLMLFALVNTALHYFFFYIGVSNSAGSRASVLNSLGTFLLVFLSCVFFEDEHLSKIKILGCVIGFSGLIVINLNSSGGEPFSFSGDGMIILNAVCSAFGGILTRVIGKRINSYVMTGYGLFGGGLMLTLAGLAMGGRITTLSVHGLFVLLVLVMISSVGFSIYNTLLQYHPVGKVAIYNSLIPVTGIMFSCLLLREPFVIRYMISAILVAAGVVIINKEK